MRRSPTAAPPWQRPAQGPVRRVGVRPVRQDRRPGATWRARCRRRCKRGHRRARGDAALRGHAVERARACSTASCRCPMWWGDARARVRVGTLPGSDVPGLLPRVQPLLRSALPLRPAGRGLPRQPRALHLPVARLAGAVQGAGLHSRHHARQRLADRAGARLHQHRRMGAAAARRGERLHDSQPRLPGRVRRRRACSSPGSGASTTTRASSSTSAR